MEAREPNQPQFGSRVKKEMQRIKTVCLATAGIVKILVNQYLFKIVETPTT
jgi:hypothetical protein